MAEYANRTPRFDVLRKVNVEYAGSTQRGTVLFMENNHDMIPPPPSPLFEYPEAHPVWPRMLIDFGGLRL